MKNNLCKFELAEFDMQKSSALTLNMMIKQTLNIEFSDEFEALKFYTTQNICKL
jgi:hypothetical protein